MPVQKVVSDALMSKSKRVVGTLGCQLPTVAGSLYFWEKLSRGPNGPVARFSCTDVEV